MQQSLYHMPRFHLRERRYVRPDYARAFRLWYGRNRHDWQLPQLTSTQESLIYTWEQRRCDRSHPNRILHNTSIPRDTNFPSVPIGLTTNHLTILYLHYLNDVVMPQSADIAILTAHVRDTHAFCRRLRPVGFRFHICSLRNPRHLLGRTCPLTTILDAHLAPPSRPIPGRYDWTDDRFDTALMTLLPMVDDGPHSCLIITGDTDRPTSFTKYLHTHPEYTLPSAPSNPSDLKDPIYPEFSCPSCTPVLLYLHEKTFCPSVFLPYTARARPA